MDSAPKHHWYQRQYQVHTWRREWGVGAVKLLVYRKKTHADQYLNFNSHRPLYQKLGVIKTLLDRCNNIVTDPVNRRKEVEHITKARQECGYTKWTIRKVREKQQNHRRPTKWKNNERSRGIVTLPYVHCCTHCIQMTVVVLIHLPNLWGFLMIQPCSLFWMILPHTSHIFLQWYVSLVGAVTLFCIWMFPKRKKCASTSVVIELSLVLLSSTVNLWNRLIHSNTSVLY